MFKAVSQELLTTIEALGVVGISEKERWELVELVAAVMQLSSLNLSNGLEK